MQPRIFKFDNWVIEDYYWDDEDVVIPETIDWETVIQIGDRAFFEKNIKSVKLPATLKFIWKEAFKLNQIEDIELPDWIIKIDDWAFEFNNIKKVILPDSLFVIWRWSFSSNKIETLKLSKNLTFIPAWAFWGNKIEYLEIPSNIVKIYGAFAKNKLKEVVFCGDKITSIWGGEFSF
jgi:hypothetical protein